MRKLALFIFCGRGGLGDGLLSRWCLAFLLAACVLLLGGCAGLGPGTPEVLGKPIWAEKSISEDTFKELVNYLEKDDGTARYLRIKAYRLLARRGDSRALPVLRTRLDEAESKDEYRVCAYAIEQCGGASQEELMSDWSPPYSPLWGEREDEQLKRVPGSPLTIAWWRERLLDVTDVFGIRFSAGPGLLVHAQATKIAQAGGGAYKSTLRAGYKDRRAGLWWQDNSEVGLSLFYFRLYEVEPICANFQGGAGPRVLLADFSDVWDRRFLDVGAAVHAGVVGADVWFNTSQLVDLVTGFFNYDFIDDDAILEGPPRVID